jgi:hypothetical protein
MPKIQKHAEFLETLRGMVTKEGQTKEAAVTKEAEKPTATGIPGKDTHPEKVPESTEHVNKNEQGRPEKNPQDFKQEKGKDGPLHGKTAEELAAEKAAAEKQAAAAPQVPSTGAPAGIVAGAKDAANTTTQKKAEDATPAEPAAPAENLKLAEFGKQLLNMLKAAQAEELAKQAEKPTATGVPGKDTHPAKVPESTEHVNKNEEGRPEKNPQEFKQEKGKDAPLHGKQGSAEPLQEELDKQASFELGRQFCRNFLQTKVASKQEVYKEAGRRDFESLIAQAAAELDNQKQAQAKPVAQTKQASAVVDETYAEKQAEEAGAQAFYSMMKQAQEEYQAEQIKVAFEQRLQAIANEKAAAEKRATDAEAALQTKVAELNKKAEEEKRAAEHQALATYIIENVMSRIKSESAS